MSEKELPMVLQTHAQEAQPTAGQLLRQAREAAGLHVAALASAHKVPVQKLDALEADDFSVFPDMVFVRALASSICRSLRLDPVPILDKLPRSEPKGFAAQSMQLNAPIKERAGGAMVAGSNGVSRKALWSVAALLLAAAIVYFMPYGALDKAAQGDSSPVTLHQPQEVIPAPAAVLPAAQLEPALPVEPTAPAAALSEPTAPAPAPATALIPAQAAAVAQPAAQSPAAALADVAGAGNAVLVFRTTGESWVTVTDSKGVKLLDRRLDAGETVPVSASAPLSVVVGRADLTTVQLRGQAFDLPAVSRGHVARFEVKE